MQQLSVFPKNTTKGIDLKDDNQSLTTTDNSKKESFSALVDKQISDDSNKIKNTEKEQSSAKALQDNAEDRVAKGNPASKNDNVSVDDGNNGRVDGAEQDKSAEAVTEAEQIAVNNTLSTDEGGEEESVDNLISNGQDQSFEQSQKFLALLYSADATLIDTAGVSEESDQPLDDDSVIKDKLSLAAENKRVLQNLLLTDQEKLAQITNKDIPLENETDLSIEASKVAKNGQATLVSSQINPTLLAQNIEGEKKLVFENTLTRKPEEPIYTILPITEPDAELSAKLVDNLVTDKLILPADTKVFEQQSNKIASKDVLLKNMADLETLKNAELATLLNEQELNVMDSSKFSAANLVADSIISQEKQLKTPQQIDKLTLAKIMQNPEQEGEQASNDTASESITNAVTQVPLSATLNQTEQLATQMNRQKVVENIAQLSQEADVLNNNDKVTVPVESLVADVINVSNDVKPNAVVGLKTESTIAELSVTRMNNDIAATATQATENSAQQAVEALNLNVGSDVVQIQKNNVSLQQETIAIFRKDFADAVKDKVMVIISQKLQQFDIRLDPPELGNMHVRVNLQNEQAIVNFTVQNQQAKEALEQNMGRLKDMLAEQGVDVGSADVKQQSQQTSEGEQSSAQQGNGSGAFSDDAIAQADGFMSVDMAKKQTTAVDFYA